MSEYKEYNYQNNAITHNFKYMLQPLLSMLDKDKNRCILDLGCGNGYLVNYLISLGYNAYGTDASEIGITIARGQNPGRFFVQDLSTDKLPEELQGLAFDTVISTEVIEHLYDPEGFIDFCRAALTPGGEIIISTPYHGYLKNLLISLGNKWDQHLNPVWLGGHIKMWSAKTLSGLLTAKGFTVTGFEGCGRIPYLWKSMIVKAKLN
ncbi:class I SAM-dependent methyltransferase [Mucilaginibacter psychrotolerans]|uniref:Class I SAM-dependent methyltransferase n=1 Tax=Mucilaginibacter psychrotolerans TaxID=1524096 RepID=A0A4Y8SR79_9SPHI|nr:class I SAM-dependent methyltransferase [Mucilaginibacter psychrotolerans]TFF40856.1 class I SAM-dependent methyltransferase [Mucilaginibacter psychrotolerans]